MMLTFLVNLYEGYVFGVGKVKTSMDMFQDSSHQQLQDSNHQHMEFHLPKHFQPHHSDLQKILRFTDMRVCKHIRHEDIVLPTSPFNF